MSISSDTSSADLFRLRMQKLRHLPFKLKNNDRFKKEDSYLCGPCTQLNITPQSFVIHPSVRIDEHRKYLGRLTWIRSKTHCPICRLVLEIVDRPLDQRSPSHVADEDPGIYARWVVDGQEETLHRPDGPLNLANFEPKTRRLLIYSDPQTFKDGYITLLSDCAPSPAFFGKQLASHDLLDREIVRKWIDVCDEHHGPECQDSLVHPELMTQPKSVLRAIDVDQMCVIEVPAGARFVALSYLWGKGFKQLFMDSNNMSILTRPGGLKKDDLPRTIKDSIKFTKLIGERYLWTDSLALIHDDGFKYHDDWIYARAYLTIVAGSGKDADAGLGGVRKGSRTWHQNVEELTPDMRLMVSHLAEDYISTSQWDSRAWTFQERMLSRRCVIFVNGRVYFQCRRTTFCEDIEMPPTNGWSLDSIDMPTRIFREPPFIQYTSAVELYTRRELTNPNDILDAFFEVQQVLEKRLHTTIYYGLFENRMNSSLIWESNKRLVRRPGFPSWSWAGWIGEIQWKFTEVARSWIDWHSPAGSQEKTGEHTFPIQIYPSIESPILWHPHNRRAARRTTYGLSPLLHFDTVVAYFSLMNPQQIHKSVVSPLRKRLTGPSALSTVRPAPADPGLIRFAIGDKDGEWCGTINLDEKWKKQIGQSISFLIMSRYGRFSEDEMMLWEGILPDSVEEELQKFDYGVFNVILVSVHEGIYYREGLGRILSSAVQRAREPQPAWRNITLG